MSAEIWWRLTKPVSRPAPGAADNQNLAFFSVVAAAQLVWGRGLHGRGSPVAMEAGARPAGSLVVGSHLQVVSRTVAVNMLPAHRAYPVDPEALLGLQDTRPSPDADGQLAPVSQPMREALMRPPGEQRRALVLAVFYGYTAREVSELDQTPVGTVKTRIRTALMRLRSQLGVRDER